MSGSGGWRAWGGGHGGTGAAPPRAPWTWAEAPLATVTVNELLNDRLRDLNNRDMATIRTHLDTLHRAIDSSVDGHVNLEFGGSIKRHTYAEGLSDVDTLLTVERSALSEHSPTAVKGWVADRLRQRLPRTEIREGALAVTVRFKSGVEIQVLPALKEGAGRRIIDPSTGDWSDVIRPDLFARKLTAVNQDNGRHVVPAIKLFKELQERLPRELRLSGYHVESIAIEAFEGYTGPRNRAAMLAHLTREASERVTAPIRDNTGQSVHVDERLGPADSPDRLRKARALGRLARKVEAAVEKHDVRQLKNLFEGD